MSIIRDFGEKQGLRHARKHVAAYLDEAVRRGAIIEPAERAAILMSEDATYVAARLDAAFRFLPAQTPTAA